MRCSLSHNKLQNFDTAYELLTKFVGIHPPLVRYIIHIRCLHGTYYHGQFKCIKINALLKNINNGLIALYDNVDIFIDNQMVMTMIMRWWWWWWW